MDSILKIDPEFSSRIPPLTNEEFQQLEENILSDGVVISPIIVWNGIIIDGHNRFRIIEKHPEIKYETFEKYFTDHHEALAWICKNQLGRRNLTPEQKKYLIGKQYESEKASHGGDRGLEHDENGYFTASSQIGNSRCQGKTCEKIASENGISKNSVLRAEAYAKAVDIADEIEPGIRSEFLDGSIKATEREIHALARADPEKRPSLIAELRKPPDKRDKQSKADKPADKPLTEMQQIGRDMLTARSKGTAEDMTYELNDALESLKFRWLFAIEHNSDYYTDRDCRQQINNLAQSGITFFQNIIKGEIQQ